MASAVEVGRAGGYLAIRVRGDGTWREAQALRAWVEANADDEVRGVVADLGDAPHLDSTFVGTLVSVQRILQRRGAGKVVLYGVADELRENLAELGIPVVIEEIYEEPFPYDVEWQQVRVDDVNQNVLTKHIVDAHELLMRVDESNVPRFSDAVSMLRESLDQEKRQEKNKSASESDRDEHDPG